MVSWVWANAGLARKNAVRARANMIFMEASVMGSYLFDFHSIRKVTPVQTSISKVANDIQVIALRDQGISLPGDLKGKRIGVFRGSNAEFFLGRFLLLNGLSLEDVNIVNLSPLAMAEALTGGRADAVMVWEPVAFDIKKKLGNKTVSWPAELAGVRQQAFLEALHRFKVSPFQTSPEELEREAADVYSAALPLSYAG